MTTMTLEWLTLRAASTNETPMLADFKSCELLHSKSGDSVQQRQGLVMPKECSTTLFLKYSANNALEFTFKFFGDSGGVKWGFLTF